MRYRILLCLLFAPFFLTAQFNLQLLGHLPYDSASLAGCLHYVDSSGSEYALVGTSRGLSIVDLSDPTQPVQRFQVPGKLNGWREMTTWGGFAYVGSEASFSGITIVDLRALPDTVYWKTWLGNAPYDSLVRNSHTVKAADGYLYVFGGGIVTNGATIADLSDPWNPQIVGKYTTNYVHDGFIRGDTLWTSEIYQGQFAAVDVADKSNPQLLITQPTPFAFTHNTGLSPDGRILFSTDEKTGAPLAAYDVSDLDNIRLLDTYFPSQQPSKEVHNVRVFNNFLINPSYGGQLTIVDASKPDNLVETGFASLGNSLVWDADPYLPSGIVFATARNEGLFIYQPVYQRAAYLEGHITDLLTGDPLANAKIQIIGAPKQEFSGPAGDYKTGAALPGLYTVEVSKQYYYPQVFYNVLLQTGQVTELNAALEPLLPATREPSATEPFSVHPTLFDGEIFVDIEPGSAFDSEWTIVQMVDLQGKIVLEAPVSGIQTRITMPRGLTTGMYVVHLGNDGQWSRGVVIIKWKR